MSVHEREEEQEAALNEALTNLPKLLTKRRKLLDEREEELNNAFDRLEKEKRTLGCGKDSDVIHLNVGGTLMATLRSTLTYVEDSMLAARFSGRWDESIAKDKDGNFFIDQPIELFLPMIDYIRNLQNEDNSLGPQPSPDVSDFDDDDKKYRKFKRMVEYFGLPLGVFPVALMKVTTEGKKQLLVTGALSSFKIFVQEWGVFELVPSGHARKIKGFEVKIGEAADMQIGWVIKPVVVNTAVSDYDEYIALDVAKGTITCNDDFDESVSTSVQNGKCMNFGKEWFIDGQRVASWCDCWVTKGAVPVFSGKGEWTITVVELGP
ncbi:hypothetical protein FisN_16Hu118 [Fistulifera solaris]|uniref:Potassium channel tetramerisation-type BTB domain-containing protein n=1 Tax=Fistulifera solaris TaxID=1519565 RepID=A0A1Z5KTR6_FISSO|nr:hypothetical protein FisN_16Hu118 [Fistulifera solaris]|eukprot:GAX29441.1 hypothetical protein FisN_16Hu118 [Fistulifera solaris]